ncbi:ArsR/SmtB family transcription factor [Paraburkholderia antibiotica]|nr:metalloregulator ArsR/SmtB family transcription factor [Paraburkholderia antibiotica]
MGSKTNEQSSFSEVLELLMAEPIKDLTQPDGRPIVCHMAKYPVSQLDRTFSALVDPTRRAILARLERQPGLSVTEIARPLPIKLPAVMKHLDVLSDAGLISRTKSGRTVSVELVAAPMEEAMAWLSRYQRFWSASLDRLANFVEGEDE